MLNSYVMKKLFILISVLAVLLPVSAAGQISNGSFSVSAGVSVGVMEGAGISLGFGLSDELDLRAGYNSFPNFLIKEYSVDLPAWGSHEKSSTDLTGRIAPSANLLLDYHPGAGAFYVTAGMFFGSTDFISAFNTTKLPDSYHNAGISYYADGNRNNNDAMNFYRIQSDENGILKGVFKTGAVRPYLGIGFGSAIPSGRVGAAFDLGVEYTGGLDLRTDAKNIKSEVENLQMTTAGVLETVKMIRDNDSTKSYDKYLDYIDKLRGIPVLPVMRFSIFVKLF